MSEKPQGYEKYIPTRLEWFVMLLNVHFSRDDLSRDGFSLFYTEGKDGDSVNISVMHYHDVDKERMNEWISKSEKAVLNMSKTYDWDSWLGVKVEIREIN